jgi:hypothetical protein
MDFKAGCDSFKWFRIGASGGQLWTQKAEMSWTDETILIDLTEETGSSDFCLKTSVREQNGSDFCWDTDHPDLDFFVIRLSPSV